MTAQPASPRARVRGQARPFGAAVQHMERDLSIAACACYGRGMSDCVAMADRLASS
jgi:hypothetical protein